MAKRVTQLTELTTPAVDDYLVIVDTSAGTTKKITYQNLVNIPELGWTSAGETWVYASASTVTIAGVDVTEKYPVGTKIRLKQGGGYKYFRVTASSFSTNTTLTFATDATYSVANSAITDNYFSYAEIATGFPSNLAISPETTLLLDESAYDFVVSGGIWSGDSYGSTRNASMTALTCYINGQRGTVAAVAARSFTASRDTYVDVLNTNGTFTLVYTEVTNNAASPALAANSIRLGIVVTGASNIANSGSINQGQLSALLPVNSSQYYQGFDSLGNPIYNTNPVEITCRRVGYASPVPTSLTDVAGVTSTFTLAKRSRVEITWQTHFQLNSGATRNSNLQLYIDGTLADGLYAQDNPGATETHLDSSRVYSTFLDAGAHTVKLRCIGNTGGTIALDGTGFVMKIR
jgi:hypothetical protein